MSLPLLLEPADLHPHLNDQNLLIVDMCSEDNYHSGHIPGAVHLAPKAILRGEAPTPGKIADTAQLESVFEQLGLTPETHVIVYDDEGGGWAGRLIWTLDAIGHSHYSRISSWQNTRSSVKLYQKVIENTGFIIIKT